MIVFTLPSLMFGIPDNSQTVVLPDEGIDAVSVLACYGSLRLALMRFNLHHFPFLNALLHL